MLNFLLVVGFRLALFNVNTSISGIRTSEQNGGDRSETKRSQQNQLVPLHPGERHFRSRRREVDAHSLQEFEAHKAFARLSWGQFEDSNGKLCFDRFIYFVLFFFFFFFFS